jgi:hypothetical protein
MTTTSPAPLAIRGWELKSLKTLQAREGLAYTATLYKDGQKVGTIAQGGYGGPTAYHFSTEGWDGPKRRQLKADAAAWAAETDIPTYGTDPDASDLLIEELVNRQAWRKQHQKFQRQGFPILLIVRTSPYEDRMFALQRVDQIPAELAHYAPTVPHFVLQAGA